MKKLLFLSSMLFTLSLSSKSYSQKKDFFPLAVGNESFYSYYVEYASYKSPIYPAESHDDFCKDSGKVIYKVIDSTIQNDTTTIWTIKEIRNIYTMEWHLDSLGIRDTTYSSTIDSIENPLYEYTTGLHRLLSHMMVWSFDGNENRFSNQIVDTVNYKCQDYHGYFVPYNFVKDVGLVDIEFQTYVVGNFSYESYSEKIKLTNVVTSVSSFQKEDYKLNLSQNYPNPFNPITTINYTIPQRSLVELKVFDILGRQVATLVNEEKPRGNYQVKFDGSSLSSGIYLYRLKSGKLMETKKLILLK
jgi:hypothetical protein